MEKTWTANELERLIMGWNEGCVEGRLRLLNEGLGLNVSPTEPIEVSIRVDVSKWDTNGREIDASAVIAGVISIVNCYLAGALGVDEAEVWDL